jgi:hypothetical protein
MSPFNVKNFLAVIVTLGPGLLLVKLADDLRSHNRRGSLVALLLLPLNLAIVAGLAWLVLFTARLGR